MSEIIDVPFPLASVRRLMSFLTYLPKAELETTKLSPETRTIIEQQTFQISMFFSASLLAGADMLAGVVGGGCAKEGGGRGGVKLAEVLREGAR